MKGFDDITLLNQLREVEEIEKARKQAEVDEKMRKDSREAYAEEAGGMKNLIDEAFTGAQSTMDANLPEVEYTDLLPQPQKEEPSRAPASMDKPVKDVVKTEKANQDAKSPNMKTKDELEEDQNKKIGDDKADKSLTLREKYESLMADYSKAQEEGIKPTDWTDAMPDIAAAMHNILSYKKGMPQMKLSGSMQKEAARRQKAQDRKLAGIDKLRSMVNELSGMQDKRTTAQAKMKQAEKEAKATKVKPTEGEKVVDREFAKEYNKWTTGGKADYEVNSKIFKEAIKDLEEGKVDTGPLEGIGARTPIIRTDARAMEDRVRKAINSMLRATLGAQFTEKEGERIFAQTFDPFKSSEDNIRAMQLELDKIEKRKDAIEDMGSYYEKKKTLAGYNAPKVKEEGSKISPQDEAAMKWLRSDAAAKNPEKAKMIMERLRQRGIDV